MKTHLGHYEIVAELGRGGMGVVYKGFEPALNRFVAIKELSPSLAHDPQLVERFLREARSMAALNDPHIIQIYFIGQENGQPFFVMEFVEGESLSGLLKREGRLQPEVALKILHQTAQGLATAHDAGVIHRDIKPGNLMLSSRGQVKIADFGIALATQDLSKKLTSTGEFVGTPGYLSPEVCLGKPVDQRSDVFSLGIVLFEMLSGKTPFSDESPLGLMLEVVKAEIPDVRQLNEAVDPQAAAILGKMLAKDPAERFQNCHDLAAALQAHPLVAQTGALKLPAAKPAASDATVVGAPTPASQPKRAPTPPPVVSAAGVGVATPAPASAPPPVPASAPAPAPVTDGATRARAPARPSVLEAQKRGGGGKLAIGIAAGLALLVAGSVFAFRAPLLNLVSGFYDGFVGSSYSDGVAAGRASNPVGSSTAATPAPEATTLTKETASVDAAAHSAASPDSSAALIAADAAARGNTVGSAVAVQTPPVEAAQANTQAEPSAPANTLESAAPTAAASAAVVGAKLAAADEATTAAAPNSTEAGAPRKAAAAQVASAEPPRSQVPPPPRIAVVALGDSAITGPARQRIEEQLIRLGFDVVDSDLLDVDGSTPLPQVFRQIRRQAAAVVVVRAEPIGSQELQYYGQSSTLYSVQLGVRAFVVGDQRPLGAGWRERVDFTTLNAEIKALESIEPRLDSLVDALSDYRPRRRS
ncbi:serine/threonine-protein kinase [Aquimonas voraii]|uniref:non-specific serine/threonine protein kinase n=1 Tax=Aquimonas voraii TaxID=265719 RepID=A0A1G6VK29_9GAMM|nr:serine/threonine-protein kinase [Aquimonas voraii]SDD53908.1 Serine/threonine protein kinase [Aquimonas voraii]